MTRFTRHLALAALAATLAAPAAGAGELGLQLYSLRTQMAEDLPAAFALMEKWGLEYAEGGGTLYDHPLDDYKAALDAHGIQVVSVDTSLDELRDNPMAAVFKARYFGAEYATFYWIPHDGAKGFGFDDADNAVKIMNEAGKLLKANGITLQYHPHGYEFTPHEDSTLLDYMLQNVTEAEFQMDVFWIKQGGADPVEYLQRYPGRFKSLHLKDRLPGTPDSTNGHADVETNVVLGQGDVGIAAVVAEAKRQGIEWFFIEDESSRVVQQVPASMAYLASLDEGDAD
ncbi:sugar phosphate isomerase/epimerase [Marinihelvus fidelis]|uniref:Sugar phosphate isomerase/epimerase n=1 Tax=Marinihelvus fidelis TaxID=2613842 RepID=A0A5N0T6B8_9GAMM|nr:sugar phosphate isomerase/epimerase [Marinihelvus fidelis]KAA9130503.1 sugar phosphate isomerase/epimerase [Marinihelvus fidelis]